MKNIIIVSLVTFFIALVVLFGAFSVENVLARKPVKSSITNTITAISEAKASEVEDETAYPDPPKPVIEFIQTSL